MNINPAHIKQRLKLSSPGISTLCPPLPGIPDRPVLPAAVLISLVLDQSIWKLLFIKRTHHKNDPHSGQIAFPGGRADQKDPSLEFTALREAQEEIGVNPGDVEILGQSCPITTVTDYQISPYVGILPWPYKLKLSAEEVEKTILIPVNWLADPENQQSRIWDSPFKVGVKIPVIFYKEYQGDILWGATAQIVSDFLNLIQEIH